MICPHCLKTIDDDASWCPHCNEPVGESAPARGERLYCEGCGARISSHDRICPKCGRPAPGILSTQSASADLAAGRTASFPRLTQNLIDADGGARPAQPSAAQVLTGAMDPSATNVLRADDLAQAAAAAAGAPPADDEDPYHKRRRNFKPLVIALIVLALVGGGTVMVVQDPFGVMPGLVASFEQAASDLYPSRQLPDGSAADAAEDTAADDAAATAPAASAALTEAQTLQRLKAAYTRITEQYDSLDTIIEDYEYGMYASDRDLRVEKSASAYGARDKLDAVIGELGELQLPEGSPYAQDVANLIQLANWARERVDMYCASWDVSLSFEGNDLPRDHQSEILAPLRQRSSSDDEARDNYLSNVEAFEPQARDS